jgi:hypothetical protein
LDTDAIRSENNQAVFTIRFIEVRYEPVTQYVFANVCHKFLQNVKVMAHPLAGANVDRGVSVEITWKHGKQRG